MKTGVLRPENFRNLAEYAKAKGLGIGSFRLKDGSSVKILANVDSNHTEVYQIRKGKILDQETFDGPDGVSYAAMHIASFEKAAESVEELNKAWAQSMYREASIY